MPDFLFKKEKVIYTDCLNLRNKRMIKNIVKNFNREVFYEYKNLYYMFTFIDFLYDSLWQ